VPIPNHVKPAIGGLIVGIVGMFAPQILAGGYGVMQLAVQGTVGAGVLFLLVLSLLKVLTLSMTIGSGGSGGVFAPSLFVGALLGAALGTLMHHLGITDAPIAGLALVGMAAVFGGAARVPIATMVMVAEMTGGYKLMAPTMLAVVISFLLQVWLTRKARYPSLYEAQLPGPEQSPIYKSAPGAR
jgi:CIC family chloride channel protein